MEDIARVDVTEIEVTPEMIEAGLAAYAACDLRFVAFEEMISEIVVAALTASEQAVVQRGQVFGTPRA